MPSPDRPSPSSGSDPAPLADRPARASARAPDNAADRVRALQARVETLYLERQALAQQVRALRAMHPVTAVRPAPPSWPLRLALRLLPRLRRRRQLRMIAESGLFDRDWYLATYPDVAASGTDPARHFLQHGAAERRDPGPHFDTGHYLRLYPDIAGNGMNPLVHYLLSGWAEGRSIRPGMAHGGAADGAADGAGR